MIVRIKHALSGWSDYVLNGTKAKPRDKTKIFTDSNIDKGDLICDNGHYSLVIVVFVEN